MAPSQGVEQLYSNCFVQQKQQFEETWQLTREKVFEIKSLLRHQVPQCLVPCRDRTRTRRENSSSRGVVLGGFLRLCLMLPIALRRRERSQENFVRERVSTLMGDPPQQKRGPPRQPLFHAREREVWQRTQGTSADSGDVKSEWLDTLLLPSRRCSLTNNESFRKLCYTPKRPRRERREPVCLRDCVCTVARSLP